MTWHGREARHRLLQRFFDNPDELVFGEETASQALRRFSSAVAAVIQRTSAGPGALCIVSHGTVMSLFAARHLNAAPYSIWAHLECPDYVELEVK
jgi:broad specificity phosphatase PhoE